jgi:hypothetical protein
VVAVRVEDDGEAGEHVLAPEHRARDETIPHVPTRTKNMHR